MAPAQPRTVYDPIAQTFHWSVVLAILVMFLLASAMDGADWAPETRRALYTSHKTLGALILFITALRLGWRLRTKPPSLAPLGLQRWEIGLSHLTHYGLYLLCFLIPLSGWAMVSAGPHGLQLFGVIPIPSLPATLWTNLIPDPRAFFAELHGTLAGSLLILLVLHVGGVLKHHFMDRNDVLLRMVPRRLHGLLNRLRGGFR